MKKVLLVDDDTIVRISLRSLIDWSRYGYEVAADASNGEQALRYLKENPVELLITDMRMPIMDGLELLEELNRLGAMPCTVVLSSYDDFKMVRESFRMGAFDYLLKSDIKEEVLSVLLTRLTHEPTAKDPVEKLPQRGKLLADMAAGKIPLDSSFFSKDYYVVQLEIDDFSQHVMRFGPDLSGSLVEPFLELAKQIPRVAAKCILGSVSPSRYLMLYQVSDPSQSRNNIVSTCRQLKNVWSNFMNLPVSAGISSLSHTGEAFIDCFAEAGQQLDLHYLKGRGTVCFPWDLEQLPRKQVEKAQKAYGKLVNALQAGDELAVEEEKQTLFYQIRTMNLEEGRKECLAVILLTALVLRDVQHNIWSVIQADVNYYQKLGRLLDIRSLEIWMNNYLRWILDYQCHAVDSRQADTMIRAKRFILDNYSNPELTLGSVAGYVGLNEKYFSSRFTREMGSTFINYLTEVRIRKAKELMDKTDLKMYEISQQVGYNNVEHFTRVFKKVCQISPSAYKKSDRNQT